MQLGNFKLVSDSNTGYTTLSTKQASELISKYNIYFTIKLKSEYMNKHLPYFNYEKKYESLFQLDNNKSFNYQIKELYTLIDISFEQFVFLTDYKEAESLVIQRLELAKEILTSKNIKPTVKSIKKQSKVNDERKIQTYLESFEIGLQTRMFY